MAADGFITDLKRKFQQGDIVLRLVYVNVAGFLAVTLGQIFLTLFNVPASPWMNYLELPAWTEVFIRRPWTLMPVCCTSCLICCGYSGSVACF